MRRVVQCLNWRAVVKKKGWIIALAPLVFCQTLPVCAQIAVLQQDDPSTPSFSRQLMELQLDPLRLRKLEKAINARDYKPAEKILVEEAERNPRSPRSAKLLAIAGGIFFLDAQYLEAAIAWKKAEAIAPLDDRNRFTLAMAYVKLNQRDGARTELEKLAAAKPQNPLFLYQLGRVLEMQGGYQAAVESLKLAVALAPEYPEPHYLLGKIYHRLGNEPLSRSEIDRFQELRKASEAQPAPESPQPPM